MKKTASLPLENWIGYRFGLVATRLGNFVAPMYASRHNLSQPAWRCLAVIARYQPFCDAVYECRNIRQLRAFVEDLD